MLTRLHEPQELPASLERLDGLTTNFANNLDNYDTIKPVSFAPIIWMVIIGGAVLAILGGWTMIMDRRVSIG